MRSRPFQNEAIWHVEVVPPIELIMMETDGINFASHVT